MDLIRLFQEHNIDFVTEGNKHCSAGFANTHCVFCSGSKDYHLGVSLGPSPYGNCWKCGWHPISAVISKLLGVSESAARKIIREYGGHSTQQEPIVKIRAKAHRLPSNTNVMAEHHRKYLTKRNFDPDKLEREWGLLGTGPISLLDHIDYKHRILAPIIWEGKSVSFQARDITNKHKQKYLACPKDRELVHHKHILYGKQSEWDKTGICVEGITDVWRLGPKAFAVFGIEYTPTQVRAIIKHFTMVWVLFDGEVQAQIQATKLVGELKFFGVDARIVEVEADDPGSMAQDDADRWVKVLIKK